MAASIDPSRSLKLERAGEGLLHGDLLVEREADEQRHRVRGDQLVGFVGLGEVQAIGHVRSYPAGEAGRRPVSVVPWMGMSYVDLHCHLLPASTTGRPRWRPRSPTRPGWRRPACATSRARRTSSAEFPRIDLITLERLRDEAQRLIAGRGIDVRLHGGGELGHDDALLLAEDELELIAQGPAHARWLLLECPFEGIQDDFTAAAERLWDMGYDLLLAHPERAAPVRGADDRLLELVDRGALLQVNATSCSAATGRGRAPSPSGCSATDSCGAWPPTAIPARARTHSTAASRRSWPAARASAWRRCSRRTTRACCSSRARPRSR